MLTTRGHRDVQLTVSSTVGIRSSGPFMLRRIFYFYVFYVHLVSVEPRLPPTGFIAPSCRL